MCNQTKPLAACLTYMSSVQGPPPARRQALSYSALAASASVSTCAPVHVPPGASSTGPLPATAGSRHTMACAPQQPLPGCAASVLSPHERRDLLADGLPGSRRARPRPAASMVSAGARRAARPAFHSACLPARSASPVLPQYMTAAAARSKCRAARPTQCQQPITRAPGSRGP